MVVIGHIARMHQQHVVVVAGNFIAAHHIRLFVHAAHKHVLQGRALFFHFHRHKHTQAAPHRRRVHHRHLFDNHPLLLHLLNAPLASGHRRAHLLGHHFQRQCGIALQQVQNLPIQFIQFMLHRHIGIFSHSRFNLEKLSHKSLKSEIFYYRAAVK